MLLVGTKLITKDNIKFKDLALNSLYQDFIIDNFTKSGVIADFKTVKRGKTIMPEHIIPKIITVILFFTS